MKMYKRRYRYNVEAEEFIQKLSLFNMEAFEKWLDSLVLQIGQQNVMQYLDEASRWNTKCQLQNTQLKCDFSQQAKTVLKQLKNFDTQDCMIWFSNAVVIGKGDVLNYLAQLR